MSSKYILDDKFYISDLKHDVAGLAGPLSFALDLLKKNELEKANLIQQEVLKKLNFIIAELQSLPESAEVKRGV